MTPVMSPSCQSGVGGRKTLVTHMWPRRAPGQRHGPRPWSPAAAKKRSSGADTQQPSESPAPRVEPNSLISVRKQIRYVKALKEIERKSAYRAPKKERTKEAYRKETLSEEERYQQKRIREKEEMELVRYPARVVCVVCVVCVLFLVRPIGSICSSCVWLCASSP